MSAPIKFYAMLSRMKYINRWGLMRNTRPENIGEHSLETAVIAHGLAVIGNEVFGKDYDGERAAVLALFHDATEIITGDMPTPVKYHSRKVREAYRDVETLAADRLLALLPEELEAAYLPLMTGCGAGDERLMPLVKAADKIAAVVKCVEEEKSGNREFANAEESLRAAIGEMGLPEADYFMEKCLPAYGMTLDELESDEGKGESARPIGFVNK